MQKLTPENIELINKTLQEYRDHSFKFRKDAVFGMLSDALMSEQRTVEMKMVYVAIEFMPALLERIEGLDKLNADFIVVDPKEG